MLNDLINKEYELASAMIADYKKAVNETEKAIASVEEKYRKMAEEESKALNAELEELKERLGKWESSICFHETIAETANAEKEPEITDTLYPENNESPCNSSDEPTEEKRQEEEVSNEPAASEPMELDEHPEVTEDWEEETEAETNEDDDDWGEPKDWN